MDEPRTPVERLEADLRRTVDRLRTLGLARLAAPFEPEPTRADAAHGVAQRLADLAADVAGEEHRTVPRLADAAVGDQVAVCGQDLLAAVAASQTTPHGPGAGLDTDALVTAAADLLLDLRRRI